MSRNYNDEVAMMYIVYCTYKGELQRVTPPICSMDNGQGVIFAENDDGAV